MPTQSPSQLQIPERALAVGAHPDDVEFGCGGTLAKWAANGCEVSHLVCTDGSKGSWDPLQDRSSLVSERQAEQRAAARALGATGKVVFLGWPDGELDCGVRQRWDVCYWIRKLRPDVVLGHDPWKRYRLHPDHRNAGFLVTDGVVAARDPHFFPEQGPPPHRPKAILLWEADQPDHTEDVSAFVPAKLEALLEHRSQFRSTMAVTDPASEEELGAFRDKMRSWMAEAGAERGFDAGEQFKLIDRV